MPAVSPTLWVPVLSVSSLVEPASPTFARVRVGGAVDLEVELAGVAGRVQVLDDLELAGLTGVGDRADDVGAVGDVTFSGPALSPEVEPAAALPLAVSTQLIDFW